MPSCTSEIIFKKGEEDYWLSISIVKAIKTVYLLKPWNGRAMKIFSSSLCSLLNMSKNFWWSFQKFIDRAERRDVSLLFSHLCRILHDARCQGIISLPARRTSIARRVMLRYRDSPLCVHYSCAASWSRIFRAAASASFRFSLIAIGPIFTMMAFPSGNCDPPEHFTHHATAWYGKPVARSDCTSDRAASSRQTGTTSLLWQSLSGNLDKISLHPFTLRCSREGLNQKL